MAPGPGQAHSPAAPLRERAAVLLVEPWLGLGVRASERSGTQASEDPYGDALDVRLRDGFRGLERRGIVHLTVPENQSWCA